EVNPAMARLLGFDSTDELRHALPNLEHAWSDPLDRQALVERVLREGAVGDHEMQLTGRDGRRLWVSINVRVLGSGEQGEAHFAGSVQDISQRRAIEQALLRSEAKYRTL